MSVLVTPLINSTLNMLIFQRIIKVFGNVISPTTHVFQYVLKNIFSYSLENEFTLWSCILLGDLDRDDRHRRTEKT